MWAWASWIEIGGGGEREREREREREEGCFVFEGLECTERTLYIVVGRVELCQPLS